MGNGTYYVEHLTLEDELLSMIYQTRLWLKPIFKVIRDESVYEMDTQADHRGRVIMVLSKKSRMGKPFRKRITVNEPFYIQSKIKKVIPLQVKAGR